MRIVAYVFASLCLTACSNGSTSNGSPDLGGPGATPRNTDTAEVVAVDRFSDAAAHLFKRSENPALPAANAPIDMDQAPFITKGLGPNGENVTYYNFDVLPKKPAPIYVLFAADASGPVAGQLNIIDVIPGEPDYNDFWQVTKVNVPANYVANTVTSLDGIKSAGFTLEATDMLVNCPVVPARSTARLSDTPNTPSTLIRGWYDDKVVNYFSFNEAPLKTTANGMVPEALIYVTFAINPGMPNGGPPSGFMTETGTSQTHNVLNVLPGAAAYSPLWLVIAYNNSAFAAVTNLATALAAPVLVPNAGDVNCPVVKP